MIKKSILPPAIEDSNNIALEKCMQTAFNVDLKQFMKYPVENASNDLLPLLAKEEHILGDEGWNFAKTRKEKVNLLKNSFPLHCSKGSKPSIINALKMFDIEAKIKEFFEYGGKPAHFQIEFLKVYNRKFNEEFENGVNGIINAYKPKTRFLDLIRYYLCNKGKFYCTAHNKILEKVVLVTAEAII